MPRSSSGSSTYNSRVTLDYKPQTKDGPMGLALIADSPLLELASDFFPPASGAADAHKPDFDAVQKGKGKGISP